MLNNSSYLDQDNIIHKNNSAKTNEMIIALKKGSYIRPHTHPNLKSESYHIIKGSMIVFVFNKSGELKKRIKMGEAKTNLIFFIECLKVSIICLWLQ